MPAGGVDTALAERLVQKAFVVRARTFGLDHPNTRTARENLIKCYIALSETEEMRELRDAPVTHLRCVLGAPRAGHAGEVRAAGIAWLRCAMCGASSACLDTCVWRSGKHVLKKSPPPLYL